MHRLNSSTRGGTWRIKKAHGPPTLPRTHGGGLFASVRTWQNIKKDKALPYILDKSTTSRIEKVYGKRYGRGNLACCVKDQLDKLIHHLDKNKRLLGDCPAYWNNCREAHCDITYSPHQFNSLMFLKQRDKLPMLGCRPPWNGSTAYFKVAKMLRLDQDRIVYWI